MKDYDQNKEAPYLKYWELNNLWMRNVPKVACRKI